MKLLIVDDHGVVREGLRRLLAAAMDAVVLEAGTSEAALDLFRAEKPDGVILDLNLPGAGGLALLKRMRAEAPAARVLVFSMHGNPSYVTRALQEGARGYVTKSAGADELLEAVRQVLAGARYLQRDLVPQLVASPAWAAGPQQALSSRELDILRLLAQGKTLVEIAGDVGVSYKTIANCCTALKDKLCLERTGDLIRVAIEMHAG